MDLMMSPPARLLLCIKITRLYHDSGCLSGLGTWRLRSALIGSSTAASRMVLNSQSFSWFLMSLHCQVSTSVALSNGIGRTFFNCRVHTHLRLAVLSTPLGRLKSPAQLVIPGGVSCSLACTFTLRIIVKGLACKFFKFSQRPLCSLTSVAQGWPQVWRL